MASVAEIDGLTIATAPAFTGLLDETYGSGAAAAYSVRRLASATTVLLRVRRETAGGTGDDDEADVAYDSNNELSLDSAISNASAGVTATTLGQFLNVGTVNGTTYTNPDSLTVTASCFVDAWTDQSGNGNDAEQTAFGSQPQIHDGTVDTDLITENGKPAVLADSSDFLDVSLTGNSTAWIFTCITGPEPAGRAMLWSNQGSPWVAYAQDGDTRDSWTTSSTPSHYLNGSSITAPTRDGLHTLIGSQSLLTIDADTSAYTTGSRMGFSASVGMMTYTQEFILYHSDQSSNRTGIEENINSDYLIYQPTDQPTSGLLYDYGSATGGTDAAAAYSVRQLSDKAILCMRIRRDMGAGNPGDDDEINIGFDSNGDLDTAAISAFCGTGTGYVTRWWDQSVNGNHASQTGFGSQPQIYNGTAVITENGKPIIRRTSNASGLETSLVGNSTAYIFATAKVYSIDGHILISDLGQYEWLLASRNLPYPTDNGFSSINYYHNGSSTTYANQNSVYTDAVNQSLFTIDCNTSNVGNGYEFGNTSGPAGPSYGLYSMQEVVIYHSDESTNRTGIESNIMTHFNIP